MAGIKGLRFRNRNAKRHEERLRLAAAKEDFREECERRRRVATRVPFGNGHMWIRTPERYTLEECQWLHDIGLVVPLDLVPHEYWRVELPTGQVVYPHGEEWLGDRF